MGCLTTDSCKLAGTPGLWSSTVNKKHQLLENRFFFFSVHLCMQSSHCSSSRAWEWYQGDPMKMGLGISLLIARASLGWHLKQAPDDKVIKERNSSKNTFFFGGNFSWWGLVRKKWRDWFSAKPESKRLAYQRKYSILPSLQIQCMGEAESAEGPMKLMQRFAIGGAGLIRITASCSHTK